MGEPRCEITTLAIFGKEVQDALELYLYRLGLNAVVLKAPGKFDFENVRFVRLSSDKKDEWSDSPRKGAKLAKSDSIGRKKKR